MLAAGFGAYYGARTELSILDQRLRAVESHLGKITDILIANARHELRIDQVEKRIDRIELGSVRRSEAEVVR